MGHNIDLFAYPNGQLSDIPNIAIRTISESGFLCACSTVWTTSHNHNDKYILGRVMISGSDNINILKHKISGNYDYIRFIQNKKKSSKNISSKYQ